MVDNSRIVLENNKEYCVIDKIKSDNKFYVYLSNIDDPNDFVVRKEVKDNNKTFIVGLDDNDEVSVALKLFMEKQKNI